MRFSCAPVLQIGFNRPDFMAAQIAAVRAARPAKLYVAVDGPRAERPGEDEKCRAVRECVKLVDWPCEVKTLFREQNLGCKMGVSGAINWFFENEESGIVLEDDCRPTFDYLRFVGNHLSGNVISENLDVAINSFVEDSPIQYNLNRLDLSRRSSLEWLKHALEGLEHY